MLAETSGLSRKRHAAFITGCPRMAFLTVWYQGQPPSGPADCSQSLHIVLNHPCILLFFFINNIQHDFGKSSNNCTKTWGMMPGRSLQACRITPPRCGTWFLGLLHTGVPGQCSNRRVAQRFRGQQGICRAGTGLLGPSLSKLWHFAL